MSAKSFGSDWQPDEPTILGTAGVVYSFDSVEGWQSYAYTSTYLPFDLHLHRRVYTSSREDFLALLAYWNRGGGDWSYDE